MYTPKSGWVGGWVSIELATRGGTSLDILRGKAWECLGRARFVCVSVFLLYFAYSLLDYGEHTHSPVNRSGRLRWEPRYRPVRLESSCFIDTIHYIY